MIKKLISSVFFLTAIISIFLSAPIFLGDVLAKDLESIVEHIQKTYESIQTLKFDFSQELILRGRDDVLEATGRALFKKPGMMKWDYLSPDKQQIVSDGKTLWIYQPTFNQVIISEFPQERNVARDFLSGMGRLNEDFSIELIEEDSNYYLLKLNPKVPQPNTTGLLIKVSTRSSMVLEFTNFDLFGNATKIRLENIESNPNLLSSLFSFETPDGTKVIREGIGQETFKEMHEFLNE